MLIQGLLQTIFFLGVVAPWRGVALAQGFAGLTPGPAMVEEHGIWVGCVFAELCDLVVSKMWVC